MFLLDSLLMSGIHWTLKTLSTAAEAEMNDDAGLREQLLEAEMRREMGEMSDREFLEIEADLLGRIREIKERREGGAGPLAFGSAEPIEMSGGGAFQVEASVTGDFYDPVQAPHTTVVEGAPGRGEQIEVLDLDHPAPRPTASPRQTARRTARATSANRAPAPIGSVRKTPTAGRAAPVRARRARTTSHTPPTKTS